MAGEISPDSGHGATPSIEIPHTLTNGHLSEEDQVTSGHDVKCGSPRDMKETKARDTGRNSHIVQTFTTDAGKFGVSKISQSTSSHAHKSFMVVLMKMNRKSCINMSRFLWHQEEEKTKLTQKDIALRVKLDSLAC